MSIIRAFREGDIDPIARLHREVFPPDSGPAPLAEYRAYFREVFLGGPRPDSGFDSLVCEEPDESLSGFLGVIPVRMVFGGRPVWVTVSTQFCVDPRSRGLTGLKLLRHHFGGPQAISVADEANALAMQLWSWAGGEAVTSYSLHFWRPLRPAGFALSLAARRPVLAALSRWLSPPARLFDALLARIPQSHFRQSPPPTRGERLESAVMMRALPEIARERQLLPLYEREPLGWHLRRAERMPDGEIERVLVRGARGELLGWYIYRRGNQKTAHLLQLAAPAESARPVFDHLVYDAWSAGMTVLMGRLDPALVQTYSDSYCLFSRRGPWMLVHSRDPALSQVFHRGEALFSSLEGEFCARFNPSAG